ncbi:MAG: hypothetical protein HYR56_17660 [Acidobacteria bacterium]|nr:hypothetical protein [Acidobacteriota bacterium]MBI3426534.1 hypothetical protein [Acidobacteriota bacterium]
MTFSLTRTVAQWTAVWLLAGVCSLSPLSQTANKPAGNRAAGAMKLTAIKIKPYNASAGALADEITADGYHNALELSLLVLVEVTGKPGDFSANQKLIVTATEGTKPVLTRRATVGLLNDKGRFYAPVWLYGPFCRPLTIKAQLNGAAPLTRKVPFQCGE